MVLMIFIFSGKNFALPKSVKPCKTDDQLSCRKWHPRIPQSSIIWAKKMAAVWMRSSFYSHQQLCKLVEIAVCLPFFLQSNSKYFKLMHSIIHVNSTKSMSTHAILSPNDTSWCVIGLRICWERLPRTYEHHISRLRSKRRRSSHDHSQGRRGNWDLNECTLASAGLGCDNATGRFSSSHQEPEVLRPVFLPSCWSQQQCWACLYFCPVLPFHSGVSFSALVPFGRAHAGVFCRWDLPYGARELSRGGCVGLGTPADHRPRQGKVAAGSSRVWNGLELCQECSGSGWTHGLMRSSGKGLLCVSWCASCPAGFWQTCSGCKMKHLLRVFFLSKAFGLKQFSE